MNQRRKLASYLFIICMAWAGSYPAMADNRTGADILPPSIVVYGELTDTTTLLDLFVDNPTFKRIRSGSQYADALNTPQYRQLNEFRQYVESQLNTDWRTATKSLTGGGIYVAIDAPTQGLAILIKSNDEEQLATFRDALLKLSREEAEKQGRPNPVETGTYRGITGYKTGQGILATYGRWLMISNKPDLLKKIIDTATDDTSATLASESAFASSYSTAPATRAGWGYARLGLLRLAGMMQALAAGRSDNPVVELLFGGVFAAVAQAEHGIAVVHADENSAHLSVQFPFQSIHVPTTRGFFFSKTLHAAAPNPLVPEQAILSISTYRDIAALWRVAPDLFTENIAAQFAQVESQLSNFFGGRSFSEDILAGLLPRFQILAVRRAFNTADPVPSIKLPAGALVMQMRFPKIMKPVMQLAFQTVVGIVNIQAVMNGTPALIMTNEVREHGSLASAAYIPPAEGESPLDGHIIHNFSPCLAIAGDYVILTTARPLAEELMAMAIARDSDETIQENTLLQINGPAAISALRDNIKFFTAQNMIQQGVTRDESEKTMDVFFELLGAVSGIDAKIVTDPKMFRIEFGLQLAE